MPGSARPSSIESPTAPTSSRRELTAIASEEPWRKAGANRQADRSHSMGPGLPLPSGPAPSNLLNTTMAHQASTSGPELTSEGGPRLVAKRNQALQFSCLNQSSTF